MGGLKFVVKIFGFVYQFRHENEPILQKHTNRAAWIHNPLILYDYILYDCHQKNLASINQD